MNAGAPRYCAVADATYEYVVDEPEGRRPASLRSAAAHWGDRVRARLAMQACALVAGKAWLAIGLLAAAIVVSLRAAGADGRLLRVCAWLLVAAVVLVARSKVVVGVQSRYRLFEDVTEARPISLPVIMGSRQGVTPSYVKALPLVTYRDDGREASCAVCLDDFGQEEHVRQLPCGHKFHAPCIDQWLTRSTRCPLCLHDVERPRELCGGCAGGGVRRRQRPPQVAIGSELV